MANWSPDWNFTTARRDEILLWLHVEIQLGLKYYVPSEPKMKLCAKSLRRIKWCRKRMTKLVFQPGLKFRFNYMGVFQIFQSVQFLTQFFKPGKDFQPGLNCGTGWIIHYVIPYLILSVFVSEAWLPFQAGRLIRLKFRAKIHHVISPLFFFAIEKIYRESVSSAVQTPRNSSILSYFQLYS